MPEQTKPTKWKNGSEIIKHAQAPAIPKPPVIIGPLTATISCSFTAGRMILKLINPIFKSQLNFFAGCASKSKDVRFHGY
ncbi:hypothetical protein MGI18_13335 [Bacillus sp. OVS6]|nr:hypothetical protein MGI18_13335 [Bacillus sp. OVS6]